MASIEAIHARLILDSRGNPTLEVALVYDRRSIEPDFPSFRVTRTYKRFMHAPPLPVHRLPGETLMGWHLWARLEPQSSELGCFPSSVDGLISLASLRPAAISRRAARGRAVRC